MNELPKADLIEIARAQRNLIFAILAGIFLPVWTLPFQLWTIYKLAKALKYQSPGWWVLGSIIPIANLITLFIISQKATKILTCYGIKVGFMGADADTI